MEGPSNTTRLVLAALISLGLIIADLRLPEVAALRSFLSTLTYPLQLVANSPVIVGRWASETFQTRRQLTRTNAELGEQNLRLRAQLQRLDALEAENMRLRDLLGSSFKVGDRVSVAELVAIDLDPYKQQVLVDKGRRSGVFEGQAVLDANAVMGQVIEVNPFTAKVLLITDASHALPVQVNRNGLRTIAMGTGRINELELPNLPNNADIRTGDLLVTSGLGGHFPFGYPVARVVRVDRVPGRPFARVQAEPNAHLDRVREVLLVWDLDAQLDPAAGAEFEP